MAEALETAGAESRLSVLEQMNRVLSVTESSYREREEELDRRFKALKTLESELIVKAEEMRIQIKSMEEEKKHLDAVKKDLDRYAETLERSMKEVMEEKLALQSGRKAESVMEWEDEKLGALTAGLGIKAEGLNVPQMYERLDKLVKRKCPGWSVLEMTQEHLCIEAGDKEVRFFSRQPVSEVQVVKHMPDAKSSKQLSAKMVGISRTAPEWTFAEDGSSLVFTYHFSKSVSEELVLDKVREFIKIHL